MYEYLVGFVTFINEKEIVLESNNIGYKIKVSCGKKFKINDNIKLYVYNYIKEDVREIFGFQTKTEKEAFILLLSVKGIGPKIALSLLSESVEVIFSAIMSNDIDFLTSFQGVGKKAAEQLILDLKSKLKAKNITSINLYLYDALLDLGFKRNEINEIGVSIDESLDINSQLKEALKILNNRDSR